MGAILSNPSSVSKDYVDTADNLRVLKAGDTMTGDLAITKTTSIQALFHMQNNGSTSEISVNDGGGGFRFMNWDYDGDEVDFNYNFVVAGYDLYCIGPVSGLILKDRTTGLYRRIRSIAGVLSTEAA